MKTLIAILGATFLIILLALLWATTALAQQPDAVLALEVTGPDTGKTWFSAMTFEDSFISTGTQSALTAILIEDLDAPEDDHVKIKVSLLDRVLRTPFTETLVDWQVLIKFHQLFSVFDEVSLPAAVDLSGMGICTELRFGDFAHNNQYVIRSCASTSNNTGELFEVVLDAEHLLLDNFGDSQFSITLQILTGPPSEDFLNGCIGCDTVSFGTTHYGIDASVFGYGNGAIFKSHSGKLQSRYEFTCDPLREVACGGVHAILECRQPHICNTRGDVTGDNYVAFTDIGELFTYHMVMSQYMIGPDDNLFSPFDPTPFEPSFDTNPCSNPECTEF